MRCSFHHSLCPRNVLFGSSAWPGGLWKLHSFLPLCNSGQILTTHVQKSSTAQLLLQLNTADLTNRHLSDNILKKTTHKVKKTLLSKSYFYTCAIITQTSAVEVGNNLEMECVADYLNNSKEAVNERLSHISKSTTSSRVQLKTDKNPVTFKTSI